MKLKIPQSPNPRILLSRYHLKLCYNQIVTPVAEKDTLSPPGLPKLRENSPHKRDKKRKQETWPYGVRLRLPDPGSNLGVVNEPDQSD